MILSNSLTILSLAIALSTSLFAGDLQATNWESIIGKPPAIGSKAEKDDFLALMELQDNRSDHECALAREEEKITLKRMFGGKNGPLSNKEVFWSRATFYHYFAKVGLKTTSAKKHFARHRPFKRFSQIDPCIKKPNPDMSFPSGHTSISRFMAYRLSLKYPKKSAALFKRADEISKNRMLGGVHFPSDIVAGKKLADYLAKKYLGRKKGFNNIVKN